MKTPAPTASTSPSVSHARPRHAPRRAAALRPMDEDRSALAARLLAL